MIKINHTPDSGIHIHGRAFTDANHGRDQQTTFQDKMIVPGGYRQPLQNPLKQEHLKYFLGMKRFADS